MWYFGSNQRVLSYSFIISEPRPGLLFQMMTMSKMLLFRKNHVMPLRQYFGISSSNNVEEIVLVSTEYEMREN